MSEQEHTLPPCAPSRENRPNNWCNTHSMPMSRCAATPDAIRERHLAMLDRSCAAIDKFGYRSDDYGGTDDLPACIEKLGAECDRLRVVLLKSGELRSNELAYSQQTISGIAAERDRLRATVADLVQALEHCLPAAEVHGCPNCKAAEAAIAKAQKEVIDTHG